MRTVYNIREQRLVKVLLLFQKEVYEFIGIREPGHLRLPMGNTDILLNLNEFTQREGLVLISDHKVAREIIIGGK